LCVNGFTSTESLKMLIAVNHSEDIEPFGSFRRDIYVFSGELPSIRNISFCADMGLIAIEGIDLPFGEKCFKFLQLLGLILIELRPGCTLGTFPYTSISWIKNV
jgi:hypothetical protein